MIQTFQLIADGITAAQVTALQTLLTDNPDTLEINYTGFQGPIGEFTANGSVNAVDATGNWSAAKTTASKALIDLLD